MLEQIDAVKEEEIIQHFAMPIERNEEGIAIIRYTNGTEILVNDHLWHHMMLYNWYDCHGYATTNELDKMHIYLKQDVIDEITQVYPDADIVVDHKNKNKLDNRLENLRINTQGGNNHNREGTSQYSKHINVYYEKTGKWTEMIQKDHQRYNCGKYKTEIECRIAVSIMDKKLYKNLANTHDIKQRYLDKYLENVAENVEKVIGRKDGTVWKGVRRMPSGTYEARITVNGKLKNLGRYATEVEGALAYEIAKEMLQITTGTHNSIPPEAIAIYYDDVREQVRERLERLGAI